jgi:HAE1 family hydrophobic/amphiphilic exporter-1
MLSLALVILVIFLFLRNISATAIPSMALPLSLVGTFAVMWLCGYSLDTLSLMALTLSVGFVVDDAIVMLENIVRHMEHGEPVLQAAMNGSSEIGFTIISMTLSLASVFLPVLFMGGVLGRLLHEFAVTIMSAVLISGFVSLTLTPMLCSRFLRPHIGEKHGALFNFFERIQDGITNVYGWWLRLVLRHKLATMTVAVLLLVGTGYLFNLVPKGFLQSEDTDQIQVRTEAIEGASFDEMVQKQQEVAQIMQDDPYVLNVSSGIGQGGTTNQGNGFIALKPRSERPHVDQVIQEMRQKFARIPGINVYLTNPPAFRIGGWGGNALYYFTLQDTNTQELYSVANDFTNKVRTLAGVQDVSNDAQIRNPQVNVDVDRDRASSLGVTPLQVEEALYSAFGQRQVSTIFAPDDQYHVVLELQPEYQRDPDALSTLYVHGKGGQLVPLSAVATFSKNYGPMSVNHLGQLPAVSVSFNLAPNYALGDAVNEITDLAQSLPSTINYSFQGNAQAFQSSMNGLGMLLLLAVAVIYIVLGILYESFIHPITILSGLPSAGFGALLALELCHLGAQKHWLSPQMDLALDLYGFVGVIMLVGIVKKNAIMMIDFALEAQRNEGKSPAEAIYQGCLVRFRPIMMTTMAALMGTLPIALGIGQGAETRRPLGVAVVGGLIFSQMVTLLLTPVFYIYMEQATQWGTRTFRRRHSVPEAGIEQGPVSSTGPVGQPMARSAAPELPKSNRTDQI